MSSEQVLKGLALLDMNMRGPAMKAMLSAAAQQAQQHVQVNTREEFYTGPPRGQTGNLLASIQTASAPDESCVYVGAEYGVYLEMGTSRGIHARHYVYRGVHEHLASIRQAAMLTGKRILGL
jgi:hypothetical protein